MLLSGRSSALPFRNLRCLAPHAAVAGGFRPVGSGSPAVVAAVDMGAWLTDPFPTHLQSHRAGEVKVVMVLVLGA